MKTINDIFDNETIQNVINVSLPKQFQIAELECSRNGKIGMEVGSLREKIVGGLFIHLLGTYNVDTNISITESEVDLRILGKDVSIKTITGNLSGVKLVWTVDPIKVNRFKNTYVPTCDLLLIQINWDGFGGMYYITRETQIRCINNIGKDQYFKTPKLGTNPRGVEISCAALTTLVNDSETKTIKISWQRDDIDFDPYKRWIDCWKCDFNE